MGIPGRKGRRGRAPEDAVVREVKEELQLDIQPVEALGRVVYAYPDVKWISLFFIVLYRRSSHNERTQRATLVAQIITIHLRLVGC